MCLNEMLPNATYTMRLLLDGEGIASDPSLEGGALMRTPLRRRPFFSMIDSRGLMASGEGPRRLSRSDHGQGGWTICKRGGIGNWEIP